MYKWNVPLPCDVCQRRRTIAVDAEGLSGFRFSLIHRRVGGCVDDYRGGDRSDGPIEPFAEPQVELLTAKSHRRQAAESGDITKALCQLAISTNNQNW